MTGTALHARGRALLNGPRVRNWRARSGPTGQTWASSAIGQDQKLTLTAKKGLLLADWYTSLAHNDHANSSNALEYMALIYLGSRPLSSTKALRKTLNLGGFAGLGGSIPRSVAILDRHAGFPMVSAWPILGQETGACAPSAVLEFRLISRFQHPAAGGCLLAHGLQRDMVADVDQIAQREVHGREQIEREVDRGLFPHLRQSKLQNLSHVTLTVGESPAVWRERGQQSVNGVQAGRVSSGRSSSAGP